MLSPSTWSPTVANLSPSWGPALVLTMIACGLLSIVFRLWRRGRKHAALWARQRTLETLGAVTWQEFEALTAETFRRLGYQVKAKGGRKADGGVDLFIEQKGKRYTVQCKHWVRGHVGVAIVREAVGVALHEGTAGAYVITVKGFTPAAYDFARGKPVHLVDGMKLLGLVEQGHAKRA